jgi:hypothetical protein
MSHASNRSNYDGDGGAASSAGSGSGSGSSSSSTLPDSYEIVCGPVNGYDGVRYRMRSVLMHPVGLPLLIFFHHGAMERSGRAKIRKYFPHLVKHGDRFRRSVALGKAFASSYADFERIAHTYNDWRRHGNAGGRAKTPRATKPTKDVLARIFKDKISAPFASKDLLALHGYQVLDRYHHGATVSVDLLIQRREDRSVALLMEFGLDDNIPLLTSTWWTTAGRAVRYLRALPAEGNNADSDAQFSGPVLLAAVQVATLQKVKKDASFHSGLLGVFLCVPSTSSSTMSSGQEYRMALLYRGVYDSLQGLSEGVGKTLRAAQALVDMSKEANSGVWSLGHNSCRVGNMVRASC